MWVAVSVYIPAAKARAASGSVPLAQGGRWHFASGCSGREQLVDGKDLTVLESAPFLI